MKNISVLDLGLGNVASVVRMVQKVGGNPSVISSENGIASAEKLIIPGVGSFDSAMKRLNNKQIKETLVNRISVDKIPVLGICLGMQILCRKSEEGVETGLCLIDADVIKFKNDLQFSIKIPHMGWNSIVAPKENQILSKGQNLERFYFVHSYFVRPDNNDVVIGYCEYGHKFCAAFQKDNIFGVQFHPEKSHKFGMQLLSKFVRLEI